MARKCKKVKEEKRIQLSQKARLKRKDLQDKIKSPHTSDEDRSLFVTELNMRPRNESQVRVRSRCRFCGRSRGVYKKFGLCRIHMREAFVRGDVPGLRKASW
jgi:small subunit ribosomal protein S14